MDRLGIDEDDLCVMLDGMDVFPVAEPEGLFEVYKTFFSGAPEGILFAGEIILAMCHD
jgi:hypothetical protein